MTDLPHLARLLDLAPHPEGGWYRETWRCPVDLPGGRAAATAIQFLLAVGEQSGWHRVHGGDELWLWHRGGPLELRLGGSGERPAEIEVLRLGPAVEAGELPQAVVPAGHWQSARPVGDLETLVSCVVSPGFDFAHFELLG